MKGEEYKSVEALLDSAKLLEGRWTSSLMEEEVPPYKENEQKAFFGHLVEKHLGIQMNVRAEPDIPHLGVEVKVSGFQDIHDGMGFNAKERLVFEILNYCNFAEVNHITELKGWPKIRRQLIVLYHYRKSMEVQFSRALIWEPSSVHVNLMQKEFLRMKDCILAGEHLSGKGFKYLDNFPKHPGKYYSKYRKRGRVGDLPPKSELSTHPVLHDAEKRGLGIKNKFFTKVVAECLGVEVRRRGNSHFIAREDFHPFSAT